MISTLENAPMRASTLPAVVNPFHPEPQRGSAPQPRVVRGKSASAANYPRLPSSRTSTLKGLRRFSSYSIGSNIQKQLPEKDNATVDSANVLSRRSRAIRVFSAMLLVFSFLRASIASDFTLNTHIDATFKPPNGSWLDEIYTMKALPDGTLLVGGNRNGPTKLRPDGSIDPAFQNSGSILKLFVDSQGDFVLLGHFPSEPYSVRRIHSDSSNDQSFRYPQFRTGSNAKDIYVQPDDKILIWGSFATETSTNAFLRLNRDGSIDRSWVDPYPNGGFIPGLASGGFIRLVDAKGFVYVSEFVSKYASLRRFFPDGSPDPSFKSPYLLYYDTSGGQETYPNVVRLDSQGRIILMGGFNYLGPRPASIQAAYLRLFRDGTIDQSFKPRLYSPVSYSLAFITDIVMLDDEDFLVADLWNNVELAADGKIYLSHNTRPLVSRFVGFYDPAKPPRIELRRAGGGLIKLYLSGGSLTNIALETSESLTNWIQTGAQLSYNGFYTFSVQNSGGKAAFFRARQRP